MDDLSAVINDVLPIKKKYIRKYGLCYVMQLMPILMILFITFNLFKVILANGFMIKVVIFLRVAIVKPK